MKRSPLHEDHAKRGAVFLEQSGWEVPAHYGDPSAGYSAVRNAVGIMDLSSRGKIRVTGEDRVKWLQSIISNDILPLTPGQGIYSTFLTQGKNHRVFPRLSVRRRFDAGRHWGNRRHDLLHAP